MVAASKLRRAQERCEAARPYTEKMEQMVIRLAAGITLSENSPKLLAGTGKDEKCLIIVVTSDRGLCGGFNSAIARAVKRRIASLRDTRGEVKLVTIGKKGFDQLKGDYKNAIVERIQDIGKKIAVQYSDAEGIAGAVLKRFEVGEFDRCFIVYNQFKSVISQVVTFQQLIPLEVKGAGVGEQGLVESTPSLPSPAGGGGLGWGTLTPYEYEPSEEVVLAELLPKNLAVQIYHALLESAASEQGARMTAMDNATRNAGDMIKRLTLVYNRTRQAAITKELIEIISGAEAL